MARAFHDLAPAPRPRGASEFPRLWDQARTSPLEAPSVLPAATQWYHSSVVHAFLIKIRSAIMDESRTALAAACSEEPHYRSKNPIIGSKFGAPKSITGSL